MLYLVEAIAFRRGIGDLLADGVRAAAERLGAAAAEAAIHTKGLEFPAHDPRAYFSQAVGYATSNRGACHLQSFSHVFEKSVTLPEFGYSEIQDRFGVEGKGVLTARLQNVAALFDAAKMCKFNLFGGVKFTHLRDWYVSVTGQEVSLEAFERIGERIFNLKRLYNVRLGIRRKDDVLPARILLHERGTGGAAHSLPPLEPMLEEYYAYRGWDADGVPTREKVEQLGLAEFLS